MNTLIAEGILRGDGQIIERVDLDEIGRRIERAEIACHQINDSRCTWLHYYGDGTDRDPLINDYKKLLRELKATREETYRLDHRVSELEEAVKELGG